MPSLLRVSAVNDCQSVPIFAVSYSTHLSAAFARIGLILLHRRIRIRLVFHDGHSLSGVPTDSLCSFAPACLRLRGPRRTGMETIPDRDGEGKLCLHAHSIFRHACLIKRSWEWSWSTGTGGEAGLDGMRQGAERTADGGWTCRLMRRQQKTWSSIEQCGSKHRVQDPSNSIPRTQNSELGRAQWQLRS